MSADIQIYDISMGMAISSYYTHVWAQLLDDLRGRLRLKIPNRSEMYCEGANHRGLYELIERF